MFDRLLDLALREGSAAFATPGDRLAMLAVVAAAALVLVSGLVKTMIPLRWLAIGSNLGFIAYGALHPSYPMLLLHAALLPLNLYRLAEMVRLTRRVQAATAGTDAGLWLRPYMRSARLKAGTVLFRKGDLGDRLYMVADGRIGLVEAGIEVLPGVIFGEIAFFSPDRRRRLTARCETDCIVLSIDESTMKQLYYQNPAFGFKLIELVAARFSFDIDRLNARLARVDESAKGLAMPPATEGPASAAAEPGSARL